MSYISIVFFAFCLLMALLYFWLPKKYSKYVLLLANILFVFSYDIKHLIFMLFTSLTIFGAAILLEKNNVKFKKLFSLTIFINILVLIFINYFSYTQNIFNILFETTYNFDKSIIHPIGISFYTLQAAWYLREVYERKFKAEKNFVNFLIFMTFFPIILQGPISKYEYLSPQLLNRKPFNFEKLAKGFHLLIYGIFKKIVIANRIAILVDSIFNENSSYTGLVVFIGVFFYSIQIYMDFSGAVDICRGVANIFGIDIIDNFNIPYFSTSIQEFWTKWHISFSTWLKENIYIPLGGNKKGKKRKYINIILTFFVSGLWHGIGAQFIVWGLLHAMFQIIGDETKKVRGKIIKTLKINKDVFSYKIFQILTTFSLVTLAWVFFRAKSVTQAINILKSIFKNNGNYLSTIYTLGLSSADFVIIAFSLIFVIIVSIFQKKIDISSKLINQNVIFRWIIYIILLFTIIIFGIYGPGYNSDSFIYSNF